MQASTQIKIDAATLAADPINGGAVIAVLPQLAGWSLQRVQLRPPAAALSNVIRQTSDVGDVDWITETTAANLISANGATVSMQDTHQLAPAGVVVPWPLVRLNGAALAAHGVALTDVNLVITATQGGPEAWSPLQFGWLADDAANTLPDLSAVLAELEARVRYDRSFELGIGASGAPVRAETAHFTALSPLGIVWVRNGQIGNAAYQIPTQVANNALNHYRFFPSVFVRRTDYMVDVFATSAARANAVTTSPGALAIFEVVRRPSHSRWVLSFDGVPRDVIVAHGDGTDWRTPLEIWNNVIVPQTATGTLATYDTYISGGARLYNRTGSEWGSGYLDYASFIEPLDGSVTDIFQIYTQA